MTWAVGAALGVAVGVAVGTGVALQTEFVMVFAWRVTAPSRARARLFKAAPVLRWMSVRARMFPTNVEPDLSVAELVTCQKTLQGEAPLIRLIWLPEPR